MIMYVYIYIIVYYIILYYTILYYSILYYIYIYLQILLGRLVMLSNQSGYTPRFPGLFLRRHFPGHHRRCRGATGFHAEQMNGLSYEDSYYEHLVHIMKTVITDHNIC